MNNDKLYYKKYRISNPAFLVVRIAGKHIKDRAKKYFSGEMIEIGCGDKSKGYLVGEYVDAHIGLDHEESLHDKSNVDLVGSAYEIPEQDESFDCVLSTAVLEHLEEPQQALDEAYRVLKTGGYAIYTAPFFWHLHEEPRDFFRYTKFGLDYLFKKSGFEVVEIKPLSGFWITFGSELNYYISSYGRRLRPLKSVIKFIVAVNNIVFWFFNKIDEKLHQQTEKWAWMYLVVVRKP